jgi:hypothetical protein
MNTSPEEAEQNVEKFLNSLLIVFHEMGVTPEEGQKVLAESSLQVDDEGFLRYITPNHFLYTLSEEEILKGGFGESDNEVVIPISEDRYFVVVAY